MFINADIISFGGTLKPTDADVASVSLWYIPGGCDYHNATVVNGYFQDMEAAVNFTNKYHYPPEMACLVPTVNKESK